LLLMNRLAFIVTIPAVAVMLRRNITLPPHS
jgi:hypothetical protein